MPMSWKRANIAAWPPNSASSSSAPTPAPRGNDVPDELTNWKMGKGAGMYLDATEMPWAEHYQMYSYITAELPDLVSQHFKVDMDRQGIFGHSMGGHGAMTIALKNPDRFKSCSAFAPIVEPSTAEWTSQAFEKYLGSDQAVWRQYDACALVRDGARFPEFLIDQGKADQFLDEGLRPWLFEEAIMGTISALTLRMQERYGPLLLFCLDLHGRPLRWHAERLG